MMLEGLIPCKDEEKGATEVSSRADDLQNMEFRLVPKLESSLVHKWRWKYLPADIE